MFDFLNKYKLQLLVLVLMLAIVIPLTLSQLGKRQETRSRATAGTVSFSFSPPNGTYKVGDTINADVMMDTGGVSVGAIDLTIAFSPSNILQFISFTKSSTFSTVDMPVPPAGTYRYIGYDASGTTPLAGSAVKIGTVVLRAGAQGIGTVKFSAADAAKDAVTPALPVDFRAEGTYTIGPAETSTPTTTPTGDTRCSLTPGAINCPCPGQNGSVCNQPLVCTNGTCQNPPTSTPTTTPTATPTTTPTPTLPPGNSGLFIGLIVPGISPDTAHGDNNVPKNPTRTVSVKVFNAQNQEVKSVSGNVVYTAGSFQGTINLGTGLTTGSYTVKVRLNNTLWKLLYGIITLPPGSTPVPGPVNLVSGDFNQDNVLTIADFNKMISCSRGLPDCTAADKLVVDMNDDGVINDSTDTAILLSNFAHRTGD